MPSEIAEVQEVSPETNFNLWQSIRILRNAIAHKRRLLTEDIVKLVLAISETMTLLEDFRNAATVTQLLGELLEVTQVLIRHFAMAARRKDRTKINCHHRKRWENKNRRARESFAQTIRDMTRSRLHSQASTEASCMKEDDYLAV